MPNTVAKTVYDYQERGLEFRVNDQVAIPGSRSPAPHGRVVAVWPAIGMIDVEFPDGQKRLAVEDVVRLNESGHVEAPKVAAVEAENSPSASRVANAFVKQALYWAAVDRKYRATQSEQDAQAYTCPTHKDITLRKTNYKRENGKSVHLLACPECMFLIKVRDIDGCHLNDTEVV